MRRRVALAVGSRRSASCLLYLAGRLHLAIHTRTRIPTRTLTLHTFSSWQQQRDLEVGKFFEIPLAREDGAM